MPKLTAVKKLLLFLIFLKAAPGRAQLLHRPPALPFATAPAYSRQHGAAFSFFKNPALLSFLPTVQAGFYAGQPFSIPELSAGAASVAVPAGSSRAALQAQHLGVGQQHQSSIALSFAQALGQKASLGARFYYQWVATAGYGTTGMLGAGLGGTLQLTPNLQSGFYVFGPAGSWGNNKAERLAAQYHLGLGYDLSEEVWLSAVFEKEEGASPEVQAAVGYLFSKKVSSRLGMHTGTGQWFFGGGYVLGGLQLHVFGAVHPRLGFSPGLQVLYGQNSKR